MNHSLHKVSRILIALCAIALASAYFTPLWQILMWAPQYPEGLEMKIWINTLTGNVRIISALNHYIGMKTIETSMFPAFKFMVYIVGFIIAVGLFPSWLNKRIGLISFFLLLMAAGLGALLDFYKWGYD